MHICVQLWYKDCLLKPLWKVTYCKWPYIGWGFFQSLRWKLWDVWFCPIFSYLLKNYWIDYLLLTLWIILHFKSTPGGTRISYKMHQYLIAWWDMARWNWIPTIFSNHGWCTWTTVIDKQGIPTEKKIYVGFLILIWHLQGIITY